MKRMMLLLVFTLPLGLLAQPAEKKVAFYAQGGYKSSSYIREAGQKSIVSETETSHHRCIILNAGFQWDINEKWRVGPSFTYDHYGTKHRSVEFSNLHYMIRVDRTWKKGKNYSVYSGGAVGVRKIRKFENETEIKKFTTASYQVWLAGATYKLFNHFFFDINTGWGASGVLCAGAKYYFR